MFYQLDDGFMIREIGEQIMAVPIGKQTSKIHGMIALTESGALLWKALEKGAAEEELAKILTENYEVEYNTALTDVKKFINGLKEQGVLK